MEIVLFHRPGRKASLPNAKPLKELSAIVSPIQVLTDNKRQDLLSRIIESSRLGPSRFDGIGLNLIHNFINHCQALPETSNSYYASPYGLLDHALNRTEAALSLFRQFILQEEGAELTEEQKLWTYALYTAGILQGIGKLQVEYHIGLFDVNGHLLKQWSPLLESMASVGDYYHFEFQKEGDDDLRRRLNLLLARLLMPASGFAWIVSNPQVLAIWLALLNEDMRSAGTLGAILIRADAIAIQRYFNEFTVKGLGGRGGGRGGRISTFVDILPESVADKERLMGIEFIKWLTLAIASGQIMINKAPLFSVPGGLLMSAEIYKWFVREHPEYKNWQAAQQAFLKLGLHGATDARFENPQNQQMLNGVVFEKFAMALPEQVQVYNLKTGKTSTMSATEFVHKAQFDHQFHAQEQKGNPGSLQHLSSSGQWETPVADQPTQQAGNKQRG